MGSLSSTVVSLGFYAPIVCSFIYGVLALFIGARGRRTGNVALAVCCAITSVWAIVTSIWWSASLTGVSELTDATRVLSWYAYLLFLYRKSAVAPDWQVRVFAWIGVVALAGIVVHSQLVPPTSEYTLFSFPIVVRLILLIFELLLIENLYLNLPEDARWHIALPCVLLGGIACLDILIVADAALYHRLSVTLGLVRIVSFLVIAPFLILAAFREQRWHQPVRLSRAVVFHSATLVLSGSVLFALALIGEALRLFNDELGWIAELSLIFTGLLGIVLLLSSRSARSMLQRIVSKHFFADRYDYRHQWLRCISTLAGTVSNERLSLANRAIRAVADVVDSPSGCLFLVEEAGGGLVWAGSWNMPEPPASLQVAASLKPILIENKIVELSRASQPETEAVTIPGLGSPWLAVPLLRPVGAVGVVVVGRPRVSFQLDDEVFNLLQVVGREVATHLAEQRATETVAQTKSLHEFSKNFAFVAHDIKNVSSQLGLLLQNAEQHIGNPEFQSDMIQTVRASVSKIDALLRRLKQQTSTRAAEFINPIARMEAITEALNKRSMVVRLTQDGGSGASAMNGEAFDAVVTHLINNAAEASADREVHVSIEHHLDGIVIDITDRGSGMTAAFIRDELFTPFRTTKTGGSGIGAFQARELVREAAGQLVVISTPGTGTTMRVILPRPDIERTDAAADGVWLQAGTQYA